MRRALAIFAVIFATLGLANADDRQVGEINRLFPYLERFLELPLDQRDRIELAYTFSSDTVDISDGDIWIVDGDRRIDVTFSEDGEVLTLPDRSMLARELPVWTSLPKGAGRVGLTFRPIIENPTSMTGDGLLATLKQANAAIRSQAGLLGFAAPKMKSIQFGLSPGTAVTALDKTGKVLSLKTDKTSGALIVTEKDMKKIATLNLSNQPTRYGFGD